MKKRKLLVIIFIFVIVATFTYAFTYKKTKSPKLPEKIQEVQKVVSTDAVLNTEINNEIKSTKEIVPITQKIADNNSAKYKIIDRSVIVPEGKDGNKKVVLLTVDDGPSSQALEMVNVFKKHNAKAIFFINGVHDGAHKDVIKKINEEGFAIGNHTWSHLDLKKEKNTKTIDKEIDTNSVLITKITGAGPKFFRPPYGDTSPYVIKYVKDHGMIEMNWSGAAKDWEKSAREKDVFVSNVMNHVEPGTIILMHEHPWSLANLDTLLTDLELKGYSFVDPKDIAE